MQVRPAGAEQVGELVAVDEVAPVPVLAEDPPADEANELIAARVSGPRYPVWGKPCAAWNFSSASVRVRAEGVGLLCRRAGAGVCNEDIRWH